MAQLVRPLTIDCEGSSMAAVLHEGGAKAGLLIVSGGLQTRAGPHRLFTELAAAVADSGYTALRYDRRGVGDSDGDDCGFLSCQADLSTAADVLKRKKLPRVIGFGLCDGASSLALFGNGIGLTDLVLLNPWSFDGVATPALPATAQRSRLFRRLFSVPALKRLFAGDVDVGGAVRSLFQKSEPVRGTLADNMIGSINRFQGNITIILSELDATAQHFAALIPRHASSVRVVHLAGADHSLTRKSDRDTLFDVIVNQLA